MFGSLEHRIPTHVQTPARPRFFIIFLALMSGRFPDSRKLKKKCDTHTTPHEIPHMGVMRCCPDRDKTFGLPRVPGLTHGNTPRVQRAKRHRLTCEAATDRHDSRETRSSHEHARSHASCRTQRTASRTLHQTHASGTRSCHASTTRYTRARHHAHTSAHGRAPRMRNRLRRSPPSHNRAQRARCTTYPGPCAIAARTPSHPSLPSQSLHKSSRAQRPAQAASQTPAARRDTRTGGSGA